MSARAKARPHVFMDISIGGKPKGRLVIQLFNDIVPKTTHNFLALCTGSAGVGRSTHRLHYQGSIFHRIIPGFMAQGGDITHRDGTGGDSVYGKEFDDENFVLTHTARGILSMANAGAHTNSSQFFITFDAASHLDGRHVVFGQVVSGWDVLDAMEKVPTSSGDRPTRAVTVTRCGTIVIASTEDKAKAEAEAAKEAEKEKETAAQKKKRKAEELDAKVRQAQDKTVAATKNAVAAGIKVKRARTTAGQGSHATGGARTMHMHAGIGIPGLDDDAGSDVSSVSDST